MLDALARLISPSDVTVAVKIDTRHMLPMEVFVGMQTVMLALLGGIDPSLHRLLLKHSINTDWAMLLGPIGVMQALVALFVLFRGRGWSNVNIYRSVSVRTAISAMAGMALVASASVLISDADKFVPLVFFNLMCAAANMAAFYKNWQTRTVLDDRIPTTHLQARLAGRR